MTMVDTDKLIDMLEYQRHRALQDAASYAEGGEPTESVYQDGVAQGLAQAIDLIRNTPDGRGIIV